MTNKNLSKKRRKIQWALAPIVLVVIFFGFHFPILAYSVPIVMLMGMVIGATKGRYVCGNLCPRGSFLDRMMSKASPNKDIPKSFRGMKLRWALFGFLIIFTGVRIYQGTSVENVVMWEHIGRVFWLMCVVTTGIAVVLGSFINPRAWCSFCPMGTMQRILGGNKQQLKIDTANCKGCKVCEKACPMNLEIVKFKKVDGIVAEPDCIKCSECIAACPKDCLEWHHKSKTTKD
ncbi:MAG: 4Fe-4S binding protein [Alphaproteobacteria bacterium]|nr:4Fe-4S binding protein [Alphaproteobacteria bacterium]